MNAITSSRIKDIVHSDSLWADMFAFLARHEVDAERIAAPQAVIDYCSSMVRAHDALSVNWDDLDAVVIHKGLISQWPAEFLDQLVRKMTPGYANPVFVVYTRHWREAYDTNDVQAFLERLPSPSTQGSFSPTRRTRGVAAYRGNGQMICSDASHRKMVIPVASPRLLGAFLNDEALVDTVQSFLPGLGKAFNLVDFGAGIGLFGVACKRGMGEGGMQTVIETESDLLDALAANTDLAGLFWKTEFMTSLPPSLEAIKSGARGERQDFLWLERKPHLELVGDISHFHVDLDFGLGELEAEFPAYLAANNFPVVALSSGLSGRRASTDRTQIQQDLTDHLTDQGYRVSRSYDGPMPFALDIFEHQDNQK